VKDLLDLLQFPLQSTIYLEATKFLADTENEENLMECQKDSFLDRLITAKIELQPDKTCENDEACTYTFFHGSLLQTVIMPYLLKFPFFSTLFCHKLLHMNLNWVKMGKPNSKLPINRVFSLHHIVYSSVDRDIACKMKGLELSLIFPLFYFKK
jgi:hypothetical protein